MPTLNWLTRDQDLQTSSRVPYRLLEEVPDLGYSDPATGNMLLKGDNREALKALLPFYAGQVKCISSIRPTTPAAPSSTATTTWSTPNGSA